MSYNGQYWARELMNKKINTQQLIAESYKETLRFMLAKFSGIKTVDPEGEVVSVPCINATPERAVAKFYQENNIILPIVTVFQSNSKEDDRRRRVKVVVPESYWDSVKQRAVRVVSLAPKALNVNYEVNIWTKYSEDMDQIAEQIRLLFAPHVNIVTKYTNSTAAFITNENNDSRVVVGDREDRIIRRKFEVAVEGYIPYPKFLVTNTGEITEFNSDFEVITKSSVDLDDYPFDTSSINDTEIGSITKK